MPEAAITPTALETRNSTSNLLRAEGNVTRWIDIHRPGISRKPSGSTTNTRHVGQRKHHCTQYGEEYTNIENDRAGHLEFSNDGPMQVRKGTGKEGVAHHHCGNPRHRRNQYASPDAGVIIDAHALRRPAMSARHVLHDQRNRRHQTGDETPARLIVTTQENIGRT